MSDNEEHGSTLDQLLERLPILDGGGRRRLTAGTIVLLSAILVFSDLQSDLKAVAEKGSSLSALLALGGLLVYATGVIVELVGEVFLARAVSNATWSFVSATERWRSRHSGWTRFILWPLVVALWGSVRAVGYFLTGLSGNSKWRMALAPRLSTQGQQIYTQLPEPVRKSIDKPLGYNSEFGRKALVSRLNSANDRRWARRQLDRPKDVLALVSAIVIALTLYLSLTHIDARVSQETFDVIKSYRANAESTLKELQELSDATWVKELKPDSDVTAGMYDIENMIEALNDVAAEADVTHYRTAEDIPIYIEFGITVTCPRPLDVNEPTNVPPLSLESLPPLQRFERIITDKCDDIAHLDSKVRRSLAVTRRRTVSGERKQVVGRIVIVVGALFLYIGFFNMLMSSTIIVIEAIGEQRASADNPGGPGVDAAPKQASTGETS